MQKCVIKKFNKKKKKSLNEGGVKENVDEIEREKERKSKIGPRKRRRRMRTGVE